VTYLFEGEIEHRDSLGTHQVIRPGEINWMTAGRGIAHSERTPAALRPAGPRAHGIQLWVALPTAHEETEPAFHHHPAGDLPEVAAPGGVPVRVLVGEAFGAISPVRTFSRMFYVEASLPAGATLPVPDSYRERAAYVVEGALRCDNELVETRRLALLSEGAGAVLRAEGPCRVVLLGGDPLDGPRHIWWNFVSSRKERIEAAKRDWKQGRFPRIPGDDVEFIPLPDR
jgi:redox-sensitive bicupin YhaK (pirin superfamily)